MIRNIDYSVAYRQGEVLFFKLKKKPSLYSKPIPVPSGIIRIGEKEGHEHKLTGSASLSMFTDSEKIENQPSEGLATIGDGGATVTHPEHKPINLPKGEYVIKTQKEATGRHTHASVKD